jgi:nicotinamide phosphoribosyltransferase
MPQKIEYSLVEDSDSYKFSHADQYPPGTTEVESHAEARSDKNFPYTVPFLIQGFIKQFWEGQALEQWMIDEAGAHLPDHFFGLPVFKQAAFQRLLDKHSGRLPIEVRAIPEGTILPIHTPQLSLRNTDGEFPWLTNFLETPVLRPVWAGSTVATKSRFALETIAAFLAKTGTPALLASRLHDFGCRGVPNWQTAMELGAAHIVNSGGTDTVPALRFLRKLYGAKKMPAFSIPATEHSTITSWGELHELESFRHWLELHPTGFIACVSDSFDLMRAIGQYWGTDLKEMVLSRDGTLVVRPDSGDPVTIVIASLDLLWEKFGGAVNEKGYKVLDPHVRLLQGDGVNPDSIKAILTAMDVAGYSADNIAFGMGGALLQQVNRDTLGYALKCNKIVRNGEEVPVFKNPKTDIGKASKGGRLSVHRLEDGRIITRSIRKKVGGYDIVDTFGGLTIARVSSTHPFTDVEVGPDMLRPIFRDGELLVDDSLDQIRERAAIDFSNLRVTV